MAGERKTSEDDITPEALEKAKKQGRINALILAGVLLLSIVLPSAYKVFAPFLFVIPLIIKAVNKVRQVAEKSGAPPSDQSYSSHVPDQIPSIEPYSYKPKDPKDPRRYKPIG